MTSKQITMSLNQIRAFNPCKAGWNKLLSAQGKTQADDTEIPLLDILESNGIEDTIWCFRVNWFEHKELYMKFVNDCVARAKEHDDAAYAAAAASASYASAAYDAAYAAAASASYASAAYDAAYAAYAAAASAAAYAAYAAYAAAASAAASAAAYAAERSKQKESLFRLIKQYEPK